jgi:hypothetical protein
MIQAPLFSMLPGAGTHRRPCHMIFSSNREISCHLFQYISTNILDGTNCAALRFATLPKPEYIDADVRRSAQA